MLQVPSLPWCIKTHLFDHFSSPQPRCPPWSFLHVIFSCLNRKEISPAHLHNSLPVPPAFLPTQTVNWDSSQVRSCQIDHLFSILENRTRKKRALLSLEAGCISLIWPGTHKNAIFFPFPPSLSRGLFLNEKIRVEHKSVWPSNMMMPVIFA